MFKRRVAFYFANLSNSSVRLKALIIKNDYFSPEHVENVNLIKNKIIWRKKID